MYTHRHAPADRFQTAKASTVVGLGTALGLWFFSFMGIAGEWFAMWQSEKYNALPDAGRIVQCVSAMLIFITMPED